MDRKARGVHSHGIAIEPYSIIDEQKAVVPVLSMCPGDRVSAVVMKHERSEDSGRQRNSSPCRHMWAARQAEHSPGLTSQAHTARTQYPVPCHPRKMPTSRTAAAATGAGVAVAEVSVQLLQSEIGRGRGLAEEDSVP
jgi:hypothetical protein